MCGQKGEIHASYAPPLGGKEVTIRFAVPRVHCHKCGVIRQVKVSFAERRHRYTKAFARFALWEARVGNHPGPPGRILVSCSHYYHNSRLHRYTRRAA